ncbi:MAG: hypothetical protein VX948_14710 [Candidatus Latescibacterota bacterium]|nr:hypothetical protein [Candidatus Latescibacterota bacterium]
MPPTDLGSDPDSAVRMDRYLPVPAPGELATAALRIGYLSDVGRYEEAWPSMTVFSALPRSRGAVSVQGGHLCEL